MNKIHYLEGIRGVGALIVFLTHFRQVFFPEFNAKFFGQLTHYLPESISYYLVQVCDLYTMGLMFLHIFWALSGYVIFRKFFQAGQAQAGESYTAAMIKRYVRLMIPCAVAVFFAYALFAAGCIFIRQVRPNWNGVEFFNFSPSFFTAVRVAFWNVYFNFDFVHSYNGPLWTIEKEMWASLLGFAMMGVIGKHPKRRYIYPVIFAMTLILKQYWMSSFLFGYILSDIDFSPPDEKPFSRNAVQKFDRFFARHSKTALLLAGIIFLGGRALLHLHPDQLDLISSLLCFFILIVSLRTQQITRLMQRKVLTVLGKISFGLYVLHWPVLCSLSCWLLVRFSLHSLPGKLLIFIITLSVCLVLAWLFYKLVDITAIKWASKISRRIDNKADYKAVKLY